MDLKVLVFVAVLHLTLSAPNPNPDSDIDINVQQVVNGGGCGGNQCCPEPKADCDFSGKGYAHGGTHVISCMKFKCQNGEWHYIGKVDRKKCGECQVMGDPMFLTFDNHQNSYPRNWYEYNGREGNFTVTQSGLEELTELSVTSYFQSEPDYPYYTAARTVCYWEPEITVCVLLPSFELEQCYNTSVPDVHHDCKIKVTVNGYPYNIGKDIKVFNALAGNILVFNHNHTGVIIDPYPETNGTDAMNSQCINVVGSMGLSVSLCTSYNNAGESFANVYSLYSHLYVWAMPLPSLKDHLYGMCDTYTGKLRNGYTMHNGTVTDGTTIDNIYEFAPTWMINGSTSDNPDVSRCTNQTEFADVMKKCGEITEKFCKSSPPNCAGFISACEFDLCRVSNKDDYAQGYENHLKIETHLNQ